MNLKHIIFAIFIILMAGCKKEKISDNNDNSSDELKPAYIDSIVSKSFVTKIFYDASKRLTKFEDFSPDGVLIDRISVEYDNMSRPVTYIHGNDQQLVQKITYIYTGNATTPDSNYFYENNNQVFVLKMKSKITWQSNKINIENFLPSSLSGNPVSKEQYNIQNDNITSYVWVVFNDILNQWEVMRDIHYEYDDKLNSYLNFGLMNTFIGLGPNFFNKNNLIKEEVKDRFGQILKYESFHYTWDYNGKNYPILKLTSNYGGTGIDSTFYYYQP